MPLQQFDERVPAKMYDLLDDSTTPGTYQFIGWPASAQVTRWDSVNVTNTDSVDHVLVFSQTNDDQGVVGGVIVPAAAAGIPGQVDLLAALLPAAQQFTMTANSLFYFAAWRVGEAINTGKNVTIAAAGGSF